MQTMNGIQSFYQASGIADTAIQISVAMILAGTLLPVGIMALVNANLTGADTSVTTIVQTLLPVIGALAIGLGFLAYVQYRRK